MVTPSMQGIRPCPQDMHRLASWQIVHSEHQNFLKEE